MFSATSLTDARSAAGSARPRQRALDRARRHRVAAAAQEQLRRQRRHRTPVAGDIRRPCRGGALDGVDEEVERRAVDAAGELRAHAGLVDLARARSPPGTPAPRGGGRRGRRRPSRCRKRSAAAGVVAARRSASPAAVRRKGFRTTTARRGPARSTQSVQPPAASGCARAARRRRVGIGQVAEPAAADRASASARPVRTRERVGGVDRVRRQRLGAMTAREPNQSPISAAGGGSPRPAAAAPTARSTAGALPRSPSRSIRTDSA